MPNLATLLLLSIGALEAGGPVLVSDDLKCGRREGVHPGMPEFIVMVDNEVVAHSLEGFDQKEYDIHHVEMICWQWAEKLGIRVRSTVIYTPHTRVGGKDGAGPSREPRALDRGTGAAPRGAGGLRGAGRAADRIQSAEALRRAHASDGKWLGRASSDREGLGAVRWGCSRRHDLLRLLRHPTRPNGNPCVPRKPPSSPSASRSVTSLVSRRSPGPRRRAFPSCPR